LNQYTLTERYLEPQEFMVYLEFNPRDYEKYYKFAQPEGNLVFRDLDPKVQAKMLRLLMDRIMSISVSLFGAPQKVVQLPQKLPLLKVAQRLEVKMPVAQ